MAIDTATLRDEVREETRAGRLDFEGLPDDLLELKLELALETNGQNLINRLTALGEDPAANSEPAVRHTARAQIEAVQEAQNALRDRLDAVRRRRQAVADEKRELREAEVLHSTKNATWVAAGAAVAAALPSLVPPFRDLVRWLLRIL